MAAKAVCLLSGGMDSATLLYYLRLQYEVLAIGFDYGQRHRRELDSANVLADRVGVPFTVIEIPGKDVLFKGSSQTTDLAVPEGHYEEESMKLTVVPNRNMVMLSLATAYAISEKAVVVGIAAHAGDHAIYPDCRKEFVESMDKAIQLCDWHSVRLAAPFVLLSKADIVKLGASLGVPFGDTWSCYKGLEAPCWKCGTCVERREAFQLAGVSDPLCA